MRQQSTVTRVLEEDGRVSGVWYQDANGTEHLVHARYVVDASGHKSRIYRAIGGPRTYSDFFQNLALFGYFRNARRLPAPNSGNILCVAFDSGWFWYIPLSATMTSVGAVVDRERVRHLRSARHTRD